MRGLLGDTHRPSAYAHACEVWLGGAAGEHPAPRRAYSHGCSLWWLGGGAGGHPPPPLLMYMGVRFGGGGDPGGHSPPTVLVHMHVRFGGGGDAGGHSPSPCLCTCL